ncbi:indolepyruvate decarboxylase [Nocardiopsis gilva YIM 90087]|uniref:Alpha-keto-acid decarboxylase n=1 Tax=Nocardiopsis gilva YIM 90087 TaxID=1235441 RepID=A0A223S538_9ACTN|nr:alpha-keto acid decarboxylase family protein [Nocardiopsis gilva]ASU83252.1 indolepyruvate decarboxylase [Nocardiopsis gilva YIM 90087]
MSENLEANMAAEMTVGDYLLHRLAEAGVSTLFGVPGDYNLAFLDHVIADERITWTGSANELNAAYAADGYARVNGVGALLTTYGVGELSAINGIAGSYAEYLPVLHIVGAPSTSAQAAGALNHHTLGDGDYGHFARAQAEVTVAQAYLTRGNAAAEIDRVIATSLRERRPGYIAIPTDVAAAPIDPPAAPLVVPAADTSARVLRDFLADARRLLEGADSATVLADFLADRFDARGELRALCDAGNFPQATLSLGKGVLDESDPRFVGVYTGGVGDARVRAAVEQADVLIAAGVRFTDTITAGFSHDIDPARMIDLQPFSASIGERRYAPLPLGAALEGLADLAASLGRDWSRSPAPAPETVSDAAADTAALDGELGQADLWRAVRGFLRPGDIVVAEQGTAFFGACTVPLPSGATFIGQPLWGSIGFTLPAAFGAQHAAPDRRVVLLIGDGSALLTAQEIGSMVRDGQQPVIVVINNDGYTVERAIHGPHERYNDIPKWDWTLVPRAMGAGTDALTLRATTPGEFAEALAAADSADRLALVEAVLPKLGLPDLLNGVSAAIAEANAE